MDFDAKWMEGMMDKVSDETPAIPMATFKKAIKCVAEDGNYARAITCLQDIVLIIDKMDSYLQDKDVRSDT